MVECNTETIGRESEVALDEPKVVELGQQVEQAIEQLGQELDLEETARSSGALVRHRGVQSAQDLLRIVLGYSVLDWSLRLLGVWCVVVGLADISKTALLKRLRKCKVWLGILVMAVLMQRKAIAPPTQANIRVKIVDASVISQPGSQGTDWRLHLGFDLGRMCIDWLQFTDAKGGESLDRFTWEPGDLVVVDRGYANRKQVGYVLVADAWLLMRIGWLTLPLEDSAGQPFDLIDWLKRTQPSSAGYPQEIEVWVSTPQGRFAMRLVAQAIPQQAADQARRRVRKAAKKKGHTPDQRTLFAAGFVLLLTNLPLAQWSAPQILSLYRFRWQVELAFKRLKSLLNLDGLRTRDPELVQVYLLAKLLAALLLEDIQLLLAAQYPDWFLSQERPLSLWRLTALLWDEIRHIIRGDVSLVHILSVFPRLRRFLCDEPRSRPSQRARAQCILNGLCGC
jgi:hypothetical protein